MSCGVDTEANSLIGTVTADVNLTLPIVNLDDPLFRVPVDASSAMYQGLVKISNADLTTGAVGGSGTFDILMASVSAHLKAEYEKGRITGSEYTRAYIELTQGAMAQAVSFLLGREQSFWEAQKSQIMAVTAQVQLAQTKVTLVQTLYETNLARANYGLTKLKMASESQAFCINKFNLESTLPAQLALLEVQRGQGQYTLDNIMPEQKNASIAQTSLLNVQKATTQYQLDALIPQQVAQAMAQAQGETFKTNNILPTQNKLLMEQAETQRAQTLDIRSDGANVGGVLQKQKDLYAQQTSSYLRDSEIKAAKLFTDAWITQKTIDEGLEAPNNFTNTQLDLVLNHIKLNNNLS